jgi:hypothetical protein
MLFVVLRLSLAVAPFHNGTQHLYLCYPHRAVEPIQKLPLKNFFKWDNESWKIMSSFLLIYKPNSLLSYKIVPSIIT